MKCYFVDCGYLIALEVADDKYHEVAKQHWQALSKSLPPLVTTSYIFDEVITFFNNRNCHSKAVEVGNNLLKSPSIKFVHVNTNLFIKGWEYFKKHADKSYSFTDCISFVLMQQLNINSALTFDRHFMQAGFEKLPCQDDDTF